MWIGGHARQPHPQSRHQSLIDTLFNEELGVVFQVHKKHEIEFHRCYATCGPPPGLIKKIGRVPRSSESQLSIYHGLTCIYRRSRSDLQQRWSSTWHQMQRLRDNPKCADEEQNNILSPTDPGLSYNLTFNPKENIIPFKTSLSSRIFTNPVLPSSANKA